MEDVSKQFLGTKRFTLCCLPVCPVCDAGVLWPNGQDETWHAGRPWPWPHCFRWGPTSSFQKGGQSLQFSAHVCCGQVAAWIKMPLGNWYGGSSRSKRLCLRSAHVYCGQTAGWIKMSLGMEVGLGPATLC